ncbi:MAG: S9 family peptidase, partial [Chlamydiae bacterium]|nr:S9 family peptidase [Chlamydiota bacterium]
LDSLIGPYPQAKKRYEELSPIHHIDKMNTPLLLLQGNQDSVVDPSQSELLYKALLKKGIPVIYRLFDNEGHGFRMATTLQSCLEEEYSFYKQFLSSK